MPPGNPREIVPKSPSLSPRQRTDSVLDRVECLRGRAVLRDPDPERLDRKIKRQKDYQNIGDIGDIFLFPNFSV